MQKKDILELIKYHSEENGIAFRDKSYEIAQFFEKNGDYQLSEYIMALLTDSNVFAPQMYSHKLDYLKKEPHCDTALNLPQLISRDIDGIVNAVNKNIGINKILFEGKPGTGKTAMAKKLARMLERDLYIADFCGIIDSKLGQTAKNLTTMFDEIKSLPHPEEVVLLFDEIDAIALDRVNDHDVREMGRVTSSFIKELDNLNTSVVLVATTNLFDKIDHAIVRRFDTVVNFDRYSKEDLINVALQYFSQIISNFENADKDVRLIRKILAMANALPSPGELKNIIKTSLAFSDNNSPTDYLRLLYLKINNSDTMHGVKELYEKKFTLREIAILTGVSKTQASRILNIGDVSNE